MSFNIRYGTADDGANAWPARRDLAVATILAFGPDLLGTQETLAFQRDELAQALPEFATVAAGRDDGGDRGEMMAVFYRRERFDLLDAGHVWLSDTPDVPGSRSFGNTLPRMATWLVLRARSAPERTILFVNTHFDHQSEPSRVASARQLRAFVDARLVDVPVVVTGDFNTGPDSPSHALLVGDGRLRDTLREAHPDPTGPEGTFHGFRGEAALARIDWILASDAFTTRSAGIDRSRGPDGRWPSDHFPVTAVLELRR
jgi:endonuclease/exonuclease/phosphatase family metal-dependent hydrolase